MKSKKILAALVVLTVVIAAVAGVLLWRGGTASAPDTKTETAQNNAEKETINDACELVTSQDISNVFGVDFNEGRPDQAVTSSDNMKGGVCTFEQINDGSVEGMNKAVSVRITIDNYQSVDNAKKAIETTKSTAEVEGKVYFVKTDAPGIGDEAFFFQNQAPAVLKSEHYLYARKGSQVVNFVAVQLSGIDHDKAGVALTELAKKGLNKN